MDGATGWGPDDRSTRIGLFAGVGLAVIHVGRVLYEVGQPLDPVFIPGRLPALMLPGVRGGLAIFVGPGFAVGLGAAYLATREADPEELSDARVIGYLIGTFYVLSVASMALLTVAQAIQSVTGGPAMDSRALTFLLLGLGVAIPVTALVVIPAAVGYAFGARLIGEL